MQIDVSWGCAPSTAGSCSQNDSEKAQHSNRGTPDGAYGRAPSLSTMKSGPLFGGSGGAERDEPLAFLPMHLPASVRELYLEAGAISRGGVRVLGAALHSAPNLSTLSLAQGSLRPTDLTPLFTLLQGQGGAGAPPCPWSNVKSGVRSVGRSEPCASESVDRLGAARDRARLQVCLLYTSPSPRD